MPCFHPLAAYKSADGTITFSKSSVLPSGAVPLMLPCGQCIGCRLEYARQWAIRCVCEASLYSDNCFITLTYNDENLPVDSSVHVSAIQKFFKRLRKKYGSGVRYFCCGEYGSKNGRPHYHAILFNFDFPDKKLYSVSGNKYFISESLSALWPFGFSTIGAVTFESAAYVARYTVKKQLPSYYSGHGINPPFVTMSRRPGIASEWLKKFLSDVYPHDKVILSHNRSGRPPRFFDNFLKDYDADLYEKVKSDRLVKSLDLTFNNLSDELKKYINDNNLSKDFILADFNKLAYNENVAKIKLQKKENERSTI